MPNKPKTVKEMNLASVKFKIINRAIEQMRQSRQTRAIERLAGALKDQGHAVTASTTLPPKLLTLKECAGLTNKSNKTLTREIKKKKLLATKVGGTWRIAEADINSWLGKGRA